VSLDAGDMVARLMWSVLVPTLLGQAARLVPALATLATRHKTPIGVVAQCCILTLVFSAACKAGMQFNGVGMQTATLGGVLLVWASCIALHLTAMTIGVFGARRFGFDRADLIAVAFAGSQKTLPIGLLLATDAARDGNPDLLGPGLGVPFAVFPMLMFHASQLFIDTAVADRMAAGPAVE
jgi:sodium/bile acid cotransporter 7